MKHKNVINSIISATAGIVIGSSLTTLASTYVQALQNTDITIKINGNIETLTDETTGEREYPLTYNNRTYIPLRSVTNLLGGTVNFNEVTNTAIIESENYGLPAGGELIQYKDYSIYNVDFSDDCYYTVIYYNGKTIFKNFEFGAKIWIENDKLYYSAYDKLYEEPNSEHGYSFYKSYYELVPSNDKIDEVLIREDIEDIMITAAS